MANEPQALPDDWPLTSPDDMAALAADTVADVEHYLDLSPLQRFVGELARRVEALEAARAREKD